MQLFVQWLTGVLLVELLLLLTHSLVDNVIGCVGSGWVLLLMARVLFSALLSVKWATTGSVLLVELLLFLTHSLMDIVAWLYLKACVICSTAAEVVLTLRDGQLKSGHGDKHASDASLGPPTPPLHM